MNAINENLPTLMFLMGIALIILILLRRSNRKIQRTRRRDKKQKGPIVLLDRPKTPSPRSGVIYSEDLAKQEVLLHERAREMMGQLDSKIRVLQQLMIQTDQQIKRMESLIEEVDRKRP